MAIYVSSSVPTSTTTAMVEEAPLMPFNWIVAMKLEDMGAMATTTRETISDPIS